jgi:hypothetical protein
MPDINKNGGTAAPRRARRNISSIDKSPEQTPVISEPVKKSGDKLQRTVRLPRVSPRADEKPDIGSTREFTGVTTAKRMGDTQQFRLPAGSVSRLRGDPGAVYRNTGYYNRTQQFDPITGNTGTVNQKTRNISAVGKQYPSAGNRESSPGATSVYIPRQQMTPGQTKYRTVNNNPVYSPGKKPAAPKKEEKASILPVILSIIAAVLILTAAVIMAFRFFGSRENDRNPESITEAYTTAPTDTVVLENAAPAGDIEITEELTAVIVEDEPD